MAKKFFFFFLSAEAVLCLICALCFWQDGYMAVFSAPFLQIATLLRGLSLANSFGNSAAIAIYVVICLLPLIPLFRKGKKHAEDALLGAMSLCLFFMLYQMINPWITANAEAAFLAWGCTFYSILIGYVVLRLIRRLHMQKTESVLQLLKLILYSSIAALVFGIFFTGTASLMSELHTVHAQNTGVSSLVLTDSIILLRALLDQIPAAFDIVIFAYAIRLTERLREDKFGSPALLAAEKLAAFCKKAVVAIVLSCIAANVLQLAFSGAVHSLHYTANIPLIDMAIAVTALLFARYFAESNKLYRDNTLFI